MSSRGAVAKIGHVTMDAYMTIKITDSGAKILEGLNGNHSLPEISHSPNSIYVKLKKDKKRYMRCDFLMKIVIAFLKLDIIQNPI